MKQNPTKEKIVNGQEEHGIAKIDAKIAAQQNKKKDRKPKFTSEDLKGKKVDGDPELESDQPIEQIY
jgi:hypothetical protein